MSTGNGMSSAAATSCSSVRPGSETPCTRGTPCSATCSLEAILSPMISSARSRGPMNAIPAAAHARAKSTFSARKP